MQDSLVLGGGCFWCLEAVFQRVKGVTAVVSGYAGGSSAQPTYEAVCNGQTGHAEVVQIHFDSEVIGLETLFAIFFTVHDPTTPNRQGNDVGTQYRSIILYAHLQQKLAAQKALQAAAQHWPDPIVTQLVPLEQFYAAESEHQNYFNTHPRQPYCSWVVAPKVQKFEQSFQDWIKV